MPKEPGRHETPIYFRLVALWATCEAFAGGLMHSIKVPFTGLMVSSMAIICIILIGHYHKKPGAIIKATLIVCIFKMMLSPHSPPTAYIAVAFQGFMGELLLKNKTFFKAGAVLLAILALVESALQRILVLLIVYGKTFWNATDQFLQRMFNADSSDRFSLALAVGYILIHALAGLVVGIYGYRIAFKSQEWKQNDSYYIQPIQENLLNTKRKKRNKRILLFIVWIIILALLTESYINPTDPILSSKSIFLIILRAILIIGTWYLILSPLLMNFIRKKLADGKIKNTEAFLEVEALLPHTRQILSGTWKLSSKYSGIQRARFFIKALLINVLFSKHYKP